LISVASVSCRLSSRSVRLVLQRRSSEFRSFRRPDFFFLDRFPFFFQGPRPFFPQLPLRHKQKEVAITSTGPSSMSSFECACDFDTPTSLRPSPSYEECWAVRECFFAREHRLGFTHVGVFSPAPFNPPGFFLPPPDLRVFQPSRVCSLSLLQYANPSPTLLLSCNGRLPRVFRPQSQKAFLCHPTVFFPL